MTSYFIALPCSIISLVPHGIFEIGAYLMAGLAGGIVSTISVHNKLPPRKVVFHTVLLLVASVICIFIGALIESM